MAKKLTLWNEDDINKVEEMVVVKRCRIKGQNDTVARPYEVGEKVKINGEAKKDMYFQLKICYPSDFKTLQEDGVAVIPTDGKSTKKLSN